MNSSGNTVLWSRPAFRDIAAQYPVGQRMTWHLRNEGHMVNETCVRRLMRLMGLMPFHQKPNTSKAVKGHKIYPYLLRNLREPRPNQVWCSMKYECVYPHAWETGSEAKAGISKWMEFYSQKRPHSALGGKPPAVVYWLRNETITPGQQVQKVA